MQKTVAVTTVVCDGCGDKSVKRSNGIREFYRRRRRSTSPWSLRSFWRVDLCAACRISLGKVVQAWRRSRAKMKRGKKV